MDKRTRLRRLKKLQYMLENHETIFSKPSRNNANGAIRFDINRWYSSCGTAACALGSACFYKPFREEGLKIKKEPMLAPSPAFKKSRDFEAGARFFGISFMESYYLFFPSAYVKRDNSTTASYAFEGFKERSSFATSGLRALSTSGNVKPHHVAKRVAKLITHYKTTNVPLVV